MYMYLEQRMPDRVYQNDGDVQKSKRFPTSTWSSSTFKVTTNYGSVISSSKAFSLLLLLLLLCSLQRCSLLLLQVINAVSWYHGIQVTLDFVAIPA